MNRFRRWPDEAVESSESTSRVDRAILQVTHRGNLDYTLFAPYHYTPDYPYPLVVWLHGPDDDERQLCRVMPHISLQNYVAVGPRGCCPPDPGHLGHEWRQTENDVRAAEQRVLDSIDIACSKYNVAEDRVFLAGYQSGGTMALRIGLRHPRLYAGAISIGGAFPEGLGPIPQLRSARRLPMLIAQGQESKLHPAEKICEELRLFHAASLHVTLSLYPCGDELTTKMLDDMHAWIMERINGVSEPAADNVYVLPAEAN